jgi:hypothetical protein
MRQNGVRGLFVTCQACGYHTEVNVDAWPDKLGAITVPDWIERRDSLPRGERTARQALQSRDRCVPHRLHRIRGPNDGTGTSEF